MQNKDELKSRIAAIEEMIQVVLLAIPRETDAYEFYKGATKKATNDRSRDLFAVLARQEKGHEAELKRVLHDLKSELNGLIQS